MAMHAQQIGRKFYHFVKCAGHGKCHCDAEAGCHKTFCDMAFDRFVMVPEQERVGNCWAPSHKVKSGLIVSLARTVYNILQDRDYVQGAKSHAARKKRDGNQFLTEQCFILQEQGQAEFLQLKMEAIGFGKGTNMGL